ncbi:MAG: tetratricopeptide repeat protein, partial [bacterium]|nr:tetratricopeptide repeat protein [bacterium]
ALNNLGVVRKRQGQAGEAIECYERALVLDPDAAEVHNNLGLALKEGARLEAAVAHFERALALQPGYPDALWNLALAREEMGQVKAAEAGYRAFYSATPTDGARIRLATLLPVIYSSLDELRAHRRRLEEEVDRLHRAGVSLRDPAEEAPFTNFYLAYQGMNDRDIQKRIAEIYAPSARREVVLAPPSRRGERIRVGFISKHLFGHTIGHYMRGFIANLDREKFEVSVFSLGDYRDPTGGYIREQADRFYLLPPVLEKARAAVAACGLDVLYYPDIGMDPFTYYLAFTRLAHVQCASFGHPVTSGIEAVDYFVSSASAEPEGAEEHYTEKLARLENFPTYYQRPPEEAAPLDRARLGLPADAHLYLCPQSLFKLRPDFDGLLGEILRGDPRGRILLLEGAHAHLREMLMARFRAAFPDAAERVVFVPKMGWAEFLSLLAGADVILDTLHFSGGRTSLEALAYGTPIVTLPSAFMRGRVTYAFYRQMGLMDCVADAPEGYVEAALRLGRDADARREMREKIRAANHVLYENKDTLGQFENFLEGAVEKVR